MTKRENALEGVISDIKGIWLRRGGKTPEAVMDVIDAVFSKGIRPNVFKRFKLDSGWQFLITLPPGLCYSDFKNKQAYFADATGGAVQIEKQGRRITLTVLTEELQRFYPYAWDAGQYEKLFLPFPVGHSAAGFIVADMGKVYYVLVAGHPGAGKSAWLHSVIVSMVLARDAWVIIIDRKKLEYGYLKNHCLVVTSLSDARTVLAALNRELDKRLDILEKHDAREIVDLPSGTLAPVVLVIDELAELDDKECMKYLNRYVRLGRAPGLYGIAATQRPSAKMSEDWTETKGLFPGTACFHVRDEVNSRIVLGNDAAALIPNVPGRGIWQFDREIEFQGMYLPTGKARKLLTGTERGPFHVEPPKRLLPR